MSQNATIGRVTTLERSFIERVVHAASLAPSAENNQPWQFHVCGDEIRVYIDTHRAIGSDVDYMFDLTAVGAAIENACIAAREFHRELQVTVLAGRYQEQARGGLVPVAALRAVKEGKPDPLGPFLDQRCTCRTFVSREQVPQGCLEQLAHAAARFPGVHVHWVTRRDQIKDLANLVALSDRIRFEFPPFQDEFFENVRFTAREAEATRDGLDVRTLELPPGGSLALKVLRRRGILRAGNRIGLSRLLVGPSRQWIRRAPVVGLMAVDAADAEHFLRGGRALERMWLTATSAGLGLHPAGSLSIFMAYAERTDGSRLAPRHRHQAHEIAGRVREIVPDLGRRVVQIAFRLGMPRPPHYRSLRLPLERVLRFLPDR